jgi:hypothetical protein
MPLRPLNNRVCTLRLTAPAPCPCPLTLQDPYGTLFVSIPSLLDPSLCPEGTHVFHVFT